MVNNKTLNREIKRQLFFAGFLSFSAANNWLKKNNFLLKKEVFGREISDALPSVLTVSTGSLTLSSSQRISRNGLGSLTKVVRGSFISSNTGATLSAFFSPAFNACSSACFGSVRGLNWVASSSICC